jgi:tRNA (guanine37-N1)-methyltransferase
VSGTFGTTNGIKVEKRDGELFRRALVELEAFDRSKKVGSDCSHLYLPVLELDYRALSRLQELGDYELVMAHFEAEPPQLSPQDILGYSPSFEVVGDIAIIEPGDEEKVAEVLLSLNKSLKVVIVPISDVEGEFRTRRFRQVAGEPRTTTEHKEHGLRYCLDLEGAYFTPRLGTERLRIASQIKPSELVLDMFAGVGPFSLLVAKRGARVVAIDKNPIAMIYLRQNIALNKRENVLAVEGDAGERALEYECMADHVIMNLPHSASSFLVPAIRAARPGGVIHYYAISPEEALYGDLRLIKEAATKVGAEVEVTYQGIVRSYAPHRYNTVIDFRVIKECHSP